jgi:hypothetical protein
LRAKAKRLAELAGGTRRTVAGLRVVTQTRTVGETADATHDDLRGDQIWLFRDRVVLVEDPETGSPAEVLIAVKHVVLSQERDFAKMQSDIELFRRFAEASDTPRDPIPTAVKVFVWRRDQGRCVKCGRTQDLEFDHIIPVVKGGSNTERNIQLLCLVCNRSKGSDIG